MAIVGSLSSLNALLASCTKSSIILNYLGILKLNSPEFLLNHLGKDDKGQPYLGLPLNICYSREFSLGSSASLWNTRLITIEVNAVFCNFDSSLFFNLAQQILWEFNMNI